MATISVPLPNLGMLSGPFNGTLKSDGKSLTGGFTIKGVEINSGDGSKTTIGGFSPSVTVKDGKASFGCGVNILKKSYTFKDGEEISVNGSISVDSMRYTVKLTGTDTKPKAIVFNEKDSDNLPITMDGSVKLIEDELFSQAGIFTPGYKFAGWKQKLTISIKVAFKDEKDTKEVTATLTRTIEWALRPYFKKSSDDPPNGDPVTPLPFPPDLKDPIPITIALPVFLYYFMSDKDILGQLSKTYLTNISKEIPSTVSQIQKEGFDVTKDVDKAAKAEEDLKSQSEKVTQEIDAAEEEVKTAEEGITEAEEGVEEAEAALEAAGEAETAAAAEVVEATAAEVAADASEAADWWTIIGGIISAGAAVAAAAALASAIAKHNESVKKTKEAQEEVDQKKSKISQSKLDKKHAEVTKAHKSEELKIIEDKLKNAKKNKQECQNAKAILKAAHIELEKMQKQIKKMGTE